MTSASTLFTIAALTAAVACAGPRYGTRVPSAPEVRPSTQTLGLVRVKRPWYAPDFLIRSRFRSAVAEYEALPALEQKFFILTDDGRYGGVYLWRSRADATGFYSDAWRRGIRARRGVDPELQLFDVAAIVEGPTYVAGDPLGTRSQSYPATATLALWPRGATATVERLIERLRGRAGLLHAYLITRDAEVGVIALWATRALAQTASHDLARLGRPAVRGTFAAPVLTDASLRGDTFRGRK